MNFVVADQGLYFLAQGDTPYKTSIDFFEFATGKRSTLLNVGKQYWVGMALSPDQKSLLYSVIDNAEAISCSWTIFDKPGQLSIARPYQRIATIQA